MDETKPDNPESKEHPLATNDTNNGKILNLINQQASRLRFFIRVHSCSFVARKKVSASIILSTYLFIWTPKVITADCPGVRAPTSTLMVPALHWTGSVVTVPRVVAARLTPPTAGQSVPAL